MAGSDEDVRVYFFTQICLKWVPTSTWKNSGVKSSQTYFASSSELGAGSTDS